MITMQLTKKLQLLKILSIICLFPFLFLGLFLPVFLYSMEVYVVILREQSTIAITLPFFVLGIVLFAYRQKILREQEEQVATIKAVKKGMKSVRKEAAIEEKL